MPRLELREEEEKKADPAALENSNNLHLTGSRGNSRLNEYADMIEQRMMSNVAATSGSVNHKNQTISHDSGGDSQLSTSR